MNQATHQFYYRIFKEQNYVMKNLLVLLILFLSVFGYSQESDSYKFIENKGQWNKNVQFKTDIEGGALYLESNKLTYSFYDEEALESYFHAHNSHAPKKIMNAKEI